MPESTPPPLPIHAAAPVVSQSITVEESAVSPNPQPPPRRQRRDPDATTAISQQPIDASTHIALPKNDGPRGFWAMIAAQSPAAIINIVVVAVVFFMINSNSAQQRQTMDLNKDQHRDMMDYIKDSAKSDRERQSSDIHTLIKPMEDVVREMKDGRTEFRDTQRKNDEKFDKQYEMNRAALEEIRKIKSP
jgi:hypothetical protein